MPRSGAQARYLLQKAALELFERDGFDATTTAQIAAKAGLTERTYFRHFADKREVLFDGEDALRKALTRGVGAAPARLTPMATLFFAFRSVASLVSQGRAFSEPRRSVIASTPALQERLAAKTARLVAALSGALGARGLPPPLATMAAEIGMAAFHNAAHGWLDEPGSKFEDYLDRASEDMQQIVKTLRQSDLD